jgi:hypothetical protein
MLLGCSRPNKDFEGLLRLIEKENCYIMMNRMNGRARRYLDAFLPALRVDKIQGYKESALIKASR